MRGGRQQAQPDVRRPLDGRVRRLVGHDPVATELLVDEFPRIRSVKPSYTDRRNELRIEVPEVNPMLRAGRWLQRLPVRDASASPAVNGTQRLVSVDVLRGGFRVALDLDRAELKVDPRSADAAAQ